MRRNLVVGNWKMNGSRASTQSLLDGLCAALTDIDRVDIAVCPPAIFIAQVAEILQSSKLAWGAQTVSEHEQGAFTGEIAANMLVDLGCQYVIVGHSERRSHYGESDQDVTEKFIAAHKQGLVPILCVGESLAQREAGETLAWIERQVCAVIDSVGVDTLDKAVIAYEPIWAIGTGKTATPQQAQEVHAFIRGVVARRNAAVADKMQLLYGGSVNAANAAELFEQADIDGALVGGASLKVADFAAICNAAN